MTATSRVARAEADGSVPVEIVWIGAEARPPDGAGVTLGRLPEGAAGADIAA